VNALNVPTIELRSLAGPEFTASVMSDGKASACPNPTTTVPRKSPAGTFQRPIRKSPAAMHVSAIRAVSLGPSRSGTRRATTRVATTTIANTRKDRAGPVETEIACVERAEGPEPGEAEDREREDDARPDPCRMDEPRRRMGLGGACRRGLRKQQPYEGGAEAARGRQEPDRVKAVVSEHELPEQRAEREPAPEPEAEQAERLPPAMLGRDVRDHRRRADEHHGLAGSCEEPKDDEEGEGVRHHIGRDAHRGDEAARDDEDLAPVPVRVPPGERLRD
jgi:hypothetical protein